MTYSLEIINLVLNDIRNNVKITHISKKYNLSYNTIKNWIFKYNVNLETDQPVVKIQRDKHKILKQDFYKDLLLNFVKDNPIITLKNIYNHFKESISISLIHKILKNNNISRKKVNLRYVYKDINLIEKDRKKYAFSLNQSEFNNFIHLDETSISINKNKIYGYSKKGIEIKKIIKHKHSREHYSCLTAISNNEIVAFQIINGSFNAELYKDFLYQNLDKFKNKVLVQDNARIHHAKIVKSFIEQNQIQFKFLPAYSPEFNPIEMMFNQLKQLLKNKSFLNIKQDIKDSLESINANNLKNYYSHAFKEIFKYKC